MKRARTEPLCRCEKRAVKRTSRKENANRGKEYWACPSRMGEGCKFFEWIEEAPTDWLTTACKKKAKTEKAGCHCKRGPVRLQSTKENANKGRWFLSCTPCNNFFQWDSPVVEQPAAETEAKYEKDEKDEPEQEEASPETTCDKVERCEGKYAMTITVPDDWDWNVPYAAMYDPAS